MKVPKLFLVLAVGLLVLPVAAQAQRNWTDVDPGSPPSGDSSPPWEGAEPQGSLTFYADRGSFQAAFPGLTSEDYSDGNTPPGGINTCVDLPSDSSSNDDCFSPGDIEDGLATFPSGGDDNVVLGDGFVGITCFGHGPNTFTDDFQIDLDPAVRAVGFDLTGCGPETLTVTVFGTGGMLGSTDVTCPALGGTQFFGVDTVDTGGIVQITTFATAGGGELICDVEFGDAPVPVELERIEIE